MIAGVISGPSTSASNSVRLSRTNSRSSFMRMVRIECIDFMRAGPLPIRSVCTKASSRFDSPVCARSSSAVPCATTRPCAITTMRSHSAATSCMMWLEKITQRPSPRSCRRKSRRPRVVITSSPLVGSSRMTLRGSCTSARAIAVLVRWPCEKPSVWRSRKSSICNAVDKRARARFDRRRIQPVQLAEVADVLARGEALVHAARIRQHTERATRRVPHRRRHPSHRPARARFPGASACRACAASWSCRRRWGRAGR